MTNTNYDLDNLMNSLGIKLDTSLLEQALTHTSYAHEHKKHGICHNERLEFLGDAVLELVVSEDIYLRYPELPEGELTKIRAGLVCEASLVKIAEKINLGLFLRLGKGEETSGGRSRPSILADTVEALIGAVFVEHGFEKTKEIVLNLLEDHISQLSIEHIGDYKTVLQEVTQDVKGEIPQYKIVSELGPDHDKKFQVQIFLKDEVISTGDGKSKKEAEQNAAKFALKKLKQEENF